MGTHRGGRTRPVGYPEVRRIAWKFPEVKQSASRLKRGRGKIKLQDVAINERKKKVQRVAAR